MKTLIVDDDPDSHKILKGLLADEHPDLEVMASGYNLEEGLELIHAYKPELLFLDIELPDGLGFELLSNFSNADFQVVFITAHDKYAVTAIKFGDLDFLLKPIVRAELAGTLDKARGRQNRKFSPEQVQILLNSYKRKQPPSILTISRISDNLYLEVDKIIRMEANDAYTIIHMDDSPKQVLSSRNFGKYVDQFELYPQFVKIFRSHMINLNYVKRYNKSHQKVVLKDGTEVDISRGFLDDFHRGMREI